MISAEGQADLEKIKARYVNTGIGAFLPDYEPLATNCGCTGCVVLITPTEIICANVGDKIALSRKVERNFRLIGWGTVKAGYEEKNEKD